MGILKHPFHKAATICSLALLALSCGGKGASESFSPAGELAADSVAINQIIKPICATIADGKCVIMSDDTDSVFYVYSMPDFSFMYPAMTKGEGPDEIGSAYMIKHAAGYPGFSFIDYYKNNIKTYRASAAGIRSVKQISGDHLSDVDITCIINDTLAVGESFTFDGTNLGFIKLVDIRTGRTLDSARSYSVVNVLREGNNMSINIMNVPDYESDGRTLALCYEYTGRMDFYDISGGRLELKKSVGDKRTVEQLRETDFWKMEKGFYYISMTSSPDCIMVLHTEFETTPLPRYKYTTLSSSLLTYDWNGVPQKEYKLDKTVNNALFDPHSGKLFCFNDELDFEQVYVYGL